MRLFTAIWPSDTALEQLDPALETLQQELSRQGVRFTARAKIHLTLRFLGNVEDDRLMALKASLSEYLAGLQAPQLQVTGLGAFPGLHRPAIVWAGIRGEITLIHERVIEATEEFAEKEENRPYHPHLTLARVSPPSQKLGRALQPLVNRFGEEVLAEWRAEAVTLVRTLPGGSYEIVSRFPLAASMQAGP